MERCWRETCTPLAWIKLYLEPVGCVQPLAASGRPYEKGAIWMPMKGFRFELGFEEEKLGSTRGVEKERAWPEAAGVSWGMRVYVDSMLALGMEGCMARGKSLKRRLKMDDGAWNANIGFGVDSVGSWELLGLSIRRNGVLPWAWHRWSVMIDWMTNDYIWTLWVLLQGKLIRLKESETRGNITH